LAVRDKDAANNGNIMTQELVSSPCARRHFFLFQVFSCLSRHLAALVEAYAMMMLLELRSPHLIENYVTGIRDSTTDGGKNKNNNASAYRRGDKLSIRDAIIKITSKAACAALCRSE
jgi:hypothetical protein